MDLKKILYNIFNTHYRMMSCKVELSGRTICDEIISKTISLHFNDKVFVVEDKEKYYELLRTIEKDEEIKSELNKKSEEWLTELRKENEIIEIEQGVMIKGNHIVKVEWSLCHPIFENMTYMQYREWKTLSLVKKIIEK